MLKNIGWWWGQPDHYDWFSSYLRLRRMDMMTRAVLATVCGAMAVIALARLASSAPPEGTTSRVLAVASGLGGVACMLLWMTCWPTRNQSVAFAVVASTSVALSAVAQPDPTSAILACAAFATIALYIAVFHTAALMTVFLVAVVAVPAIPALELAGTAGFIRSSTQYGLLLAVNLAVPLGIQIIMQAVGVDLLAADRDPLTGLLNRRAFYERATRLVTREMDEVELLVAMIDLDDFKALNDSRGHAAGDQALVAVGLALLECSGQQAVVGRCGGEEFLVAFPYAGPRPEVFGQRLCNAVAALPLGVTASVGTTCARSDRLVAEDNARGIIGFLINTADQAMYHAKRDGGNRSHHRSDPLEALRPT